MSDLLAFDYAQRLTLARTLVVELLGVSRAAFDRYAEACGLGSSPAWLSLGDVSELCAYRDKMRAAQLDAVRIEARTEGRRDGQLELDVLQGRLGRLADALNRTRGMVMDRVCVEHPWLDASSTCERCALREELLQLSNA